MTHIVPMTKEPIMVKESYTMPLMAHQPLTKKINDWYNKPTLHQNVFRVYPIDKVDQK